jgi:hypothetical protein
MRAGSPTARRECFTGCVSWNAPRVGRGCCAFCRATCGAGGTALRLAACGARPARPAVDEPVDGGGRSCAEGAAPRCAVSTARQCARHTGILGRRPRQHGTAPRMVSAGSTNQPVPRCAGLHGALRPAGGTRVCRRRSTTSAGLPMCSAAGSASRASTPRKTTVYSSRPGMNTARFGSPVCLSRSICRTSTSLRIRAADTR